MEEQQYIRFPKEVAQILDDSLFLRPAEEYEEIVLPLFRELNADEEKSFREHARANYVVGDPINEIFHPIWRDEARKMNEETQT